MNSPNIALDDPRVYISKLNGAHVYEDNDGMEYEYNTQSQSWQPTVSSDFFV